MRERLAALGAPGAALARRSTAAGDMAAFAAETGWPVVLKAVRGGYDGAGVWLRRRRRQAAELRAGRRRHRADRRGAGAAAPGAGRAGGPVAVRAGRRVPGGGDRAARRHLRRGARAGAGPARGAGRSRPSSSPSTSPPRSAWSACSRSSCSRPTAARRQRAGDAPAQLRALDDRGRPDLAVRAAPAGGARLPAGRHRADRAGGGDGERARRRAAAACRIDERLHHLFAADPGAQVHLYGKQVRPGRKIGHVTVLGDDLDDGAGAGRARRPLAAGRARR